MESFQNMEEFYEAKNILVTGGFGFVGGHVVKKLLEYKANVTVLDINTDPHRLSLLNDPTLNLRSKIQVINGDITDPQLLQQVVTDTRFHFVFHFAAYATVIERAMDDPYATVQANTMGLVNLLEAFRTLDNRPNMIFFASTDKVYGEMDGEPYDEEKTPLRGIGMYDATKLASDVLARTYHDVFGLPTVVLRICNLFGPYDFNIDYRLIPKSMKKIYGHKPALAPELYFDALEHARDYLYIDDAVRAILMLGYHPHCRGDVYNLLGCTYINTPEMLKTIVEIAAELESEHDPELAAQIIKNGIAVKVRADNKNLVTIKKQHLNGEKIRKSIGFQPKVDLRKGLEKTIQFYRNYFQRSQNHE